MSPPPITFVATFGDRRQDDLGFSISTTLSGGTIVARHDESGARTLGEAKAATDLFRGHLWTALTNPNSTYPNSAAALMLGDLAWIDGFALVNTELVNKKPDDRPEFQFLLGDLACALLPELVPVQFVDRVGWLDQSGPCSRQLMQVPAPPPRLEERSLAIIYQEGDALPFKARAEELRAHLKVHFRGQFEVTTFPGGEIASASAARRLDLLTRAFRRYRAVMFFGHAAPPGAPGGWMLTPNHPLLLEEISRRLGSSSRPGQRRADFVPELVFANCCASAGAVRTASGETTEVSPRRFLDAGVRFFVGTSMDVVVDSELRLVSGLAREFFEHWWPDPDGAVRHLYAAKRACDFHLVTALYQIYVGQQPQESVPAPDAPAPSPPSTGGLVEGIGKDDTLGEYTVVRHLWNGPGSRTFAARLTKEKQTRYLLTVLAEQYPDAPGLAEEALRKQTELRNDPHLFVPDRYEELALARDGRQLGPVHVLIAERTWVDDCEPLTAQMGTGEPADFRWVLQVGADVARALQSLHGRKLVHGNLDPGSIVLYRTDNVTRAAVKDTWVFAALGGRFTSPRYAPPGGPGDSPERAEPTRQDTWGLGVILYELATGRPPFDATHSPEQGPRPLAEALGPAAAGLPRVLEAVIRDCLVPDEQFLPRADDVHNRLVLGLDVDGADIGALESGLNARIQAGYRLFALYAGDGDEAVEALAALTHQRHPRSDVMALPEDHPGPVPRIVYRLFELAEGLGLIEHSGERPGGEVRVPWVTAADEKLTEVDPNVVAMVNADRILAHIADTIKPEIVSGRAGAELQFPIVLIRGNDWWSVNPSAWRRLRQFYDDPARSPAVVLADNEIFVTNSLVPLFTGVALPPPRPAVLFETVRKYVQAHNRETDPRASSALAMALTRRLYPCPLREAEQILRQCVLRDGTVSARAIALRDELREREFRALGTASYTPSEKLPNLDALGLPDRAYRDAHRWVAHLRDGSERSDTSGVPRLVLITGGEGCGKTCLARALAGSAGRPLVRLDANSWLRGGLGESEATLGKVLRAVSDLHHAVVLFDELDRFFPPPNAAAPDYQPTLTRMAAIMVRWLDHQPPGIVSVLVARGPEGLPPEWQRRVQLRLDLPVPDSLPAQEAVEYRTRVFSAVFARCGLGPLAGNVELLRRLADLTRPGRLPQKLPSPLARRWPDLFRGHTIELQTGAQIEAWVHETITLLHTPTSSAHARDFWWNAVPQ